MYFSNTEYLSIHLKYLVQIRRNTPPVRAVRHLRHQKVHSERNNQSYRVLCVEVASGGKKGREDIQISNICLCIVCVHMRCPPPLQLLLLWGRWCSTWGQEATACWDTKVMCKQFGCQGFARVTRCINCFFTFLSLLWPASLFRLLSTFVSSLYSPRWYWTLPCSASFYSLLLLLLS